ncbi:MAG: hypothetical protein WC663_05765 [Patescibacteria group bacterium]|jgi:hypothetical protein
MRRYLLICLAIVGLFLFGQNVLAADWQSQELEASAGSVNALAIDQNNKVHISYFDNTNSDLKYATNSSGTWMAEIVDNSVNVGNSSLGIDVNGKVYIVYEDRTNDWLKYANNVNGTWVFEIIDNSGTIGLGQVSMALDGNKKIYVSYYDSDNSNLKYATNVSGSWANETIDSSTDVGGSSSLALDSNNKVHISYRDTTNSDLKYITNDSGSWLSVVLDSNGSVGLQSSIAIDSNNKIHIAYLDYTNSDLKYITNISGAWVASVIDNDSAGQVGYYPSLKIDDNNKLHVAYHDILNGRLKYATNVSGQWSIYNQQDTGSYSLLFSFETFNAYYRPISLGIDSMNRTHVIYFKTSAGLVNTSLNYTYTPGPSVQTITINNGRDYSAYRKINIASSVSGSPTEMIVSTKSDFSNKIWSSYLANTIFKMPSKKGIKTIYVKFRDVYSAESAVVSFNVKYVGNPKFVTKKAKKKNEVRIKKKNKKYYARELNLTFKKYPKAFKKTKRYFLVVRKKKFTKLFVDAKHNLLKKYWKINTDFSKYKLSKNVKLKLVFSYSKKEFKKLKKKVKGLKEKNLYLKAYNLKSKKWTNLSAKRNTKKNTFTVYLKSPFNFSQRYYAIGK